jgi:hypothetical protein
VELKYKIEPAPINEIPRIDVFRFVFVFEFEFVFECVYDDS